MKLINVRIEKYRSIQDTEEFEIESRKTILVGPNEAGKTAVLQALQQINAPKEAKNFDALRDYPRAAYSKDIASGNVDPKKVEISTAEFSLDDDDKADIDSAFHSCTYVFTRKLSNEAAHHLKGGPQIPTYDSQKKEFVRLASHADKNFAKDPDTEKAKPSETLNELTSEWLGHYPISGDRAKALQKWLNEISDYVDESNATAEKRFDNLNQKVGLDERRNSVLVKLNERLPLFVFFSNYFRVRPIIHLANLAARLKSGAYDDDQYDYGNECLLKLLNFTAEELSKLGDATAPPQNDAEAFEEYRKKLDERSYRLNAASVQLTNEIRRIWNPDPKKAEADKLRIVADGQYLKVVVEDELDQRSEGFQWLVSFFVVFFAEASGEHENAILLLDEPGMSLHGLKQREFRETVSRLAETNQVIYTTHSPFLVGPDELDIVRVVEMTDRTVGTKVHTEVMADDPAAILPLQEALGYDLAQSLFSAKRNLVLEGLTDYWYIEGVAELLRESGDIIINSKISLVPAKGAGKVVYFATILHAHKLKVAALLDSDAAGDQAATQEVLVHKLGNKNILRTKDAYTGEVIKPEIEDLLRDTLVSIAKDDLSWDVAAVAAAQPKRPIIEIFITEVNNFSKYRLAKAFLRWTRVHEASNLKVHEIDQWKTLIKTINKVLK